jgi:hypothetical protein
MKRTNTLLSKIWLLLPITLLSITWAAKPTVSDILTKFDALQTLGSDATARVDMVQKDRDQGTKVMESIFYGRDRENLFLIVMTKPESEKGNGYLKSGKNFWMYRRNTRTFQHVNRDESIAGSDASAGDFETSNYLDSYESDSKLSSQEGVYEEMLGKIPVYKISIKAKIPDVDYPKKKLWVRRDNLLPLKEQSYSLSGSLMVTQYFLKYSKVKDKFIAIKQLVVDEFEKGNKTLWEIKDISFEDIDNSVFTKAYLENLSK